MLGGEGAGEEGGPGGFEGVVDLVEAEDAFAVEAVVVALEAGAEAGHDQDVDGVVEVPALQSELWPESRCGEGVGILGGGVDLLAQSLRGGGGGIGHSCDIREGV